MSEVDGSYLVARTLKEENTECLFYLMGGPNYEIINNSEDLGIKTYDFRHEQAAAMAAHAYSRVTRKPGVTTAASGPGTLNLLTGQYNAFIDCAPMITLGGAGPVKDFYRGGFQEIDQVSIFEKVSKATFRPTFAHQYPQVISHAFRISQSGRPGPVYIDCNEDVLYEKINEKDTSKATRSELSSGPSGDESIIKQTIELLKNSNAPIIFAGGGSFWSDSSKELKEFIDNSGIPFYTTPMSRGIVSDDHQYSFPAARSSAFRETDFVLVLGTRFNWIMTYGNRINPDAKIIQVDILEEEIAHNRDVSLGIVGDCKAVISQLSEEFKNKNLKSSKWDKWREHLSNLNNERLERVKPLEESNQIPIHPLRLCKELRDIMDKSSIVTIDGNEILHYGRQSIPSFFPGHSINSGPTGCMGVGLPYAIGAKIAKPQNQVFSLHGDGSLGMNIQDFDTAVRHNLPIIILVSNNEGWTARVEGIRKPGRELGFTRFDLIAESLGGYGEMVEKPDEIKPAIERAIDSGLPSIINVHTDPTARAISKFVGSKME